MKIKLLTPTAKVPVRATSGSAGYDLFFDGIAPNTDAYMTHIITISTGIAVEIPQGYVGLLFPRSSIYKTNLRLANSVGVIDSDYRGDVRVIFDTRMFPGMFGYNVGDRVAQLVLTPVYNPELTVTEELDPTQRWLGGFGSTGK